MANRPRARRPRRGRRPDPLDYLDEGVAALSDQGLNVTRDTVGGEDHYLIFTAPERLERTLGDWLDAAGAR